uniref:Thyroglobulin type-1 domain-containing protein n=1 Tax=Amblyomma triste TaxID=251400 RepID=A0A023GB76_AMBTT
MLRTAPCTIAIFALVSCIYCATTRESDCQRRRRTEQRVTRNQAGLLVPECDENGEYLAIQCFGQTVGGGRPFCACYDREFGQIKAPSRHLKSCNCIRKHHEWEHNRGRQSENEPRCNATSGEFNAVQCSHSEHWCVDRDSGVLLGEKRSGGCTSDLSEESCGIGGDRHGHGAGRGDPTYRGGSSQHDAGAHQGGSARHTEGSDTESTSRYEDDTAHHGTRARQNGSQSHSRSS